MRPPNRSAVQLLPVALLLVAIVVHGVRITVYNEDAQRGSAFAMFATVDTGRTREVLATVPGDPPIVLEIPGAMDELRVRVRDVPSEDSARRLASDLRDLTWEVDGHTASVGEGRTFGEVRVQVVGLEAEGRTVSRQVHADVMVGSARP